MHTDVNTTHKYYAVVNRFSLEVAVTTVLCIRPLEIIVCKFGRSPAICLGEAIFVPAQNCCDMVIANGIRQNCPYHVSFDLDLDLEHILDAGSPADHPVQLW